MWPLNLQHIIGVNSVKHNCPNKGLNHRGSFGLSNRFNKVDRGSIQEMS